MINKFLVKHPLITEKVTEISKQGKYAFLVDKKATSPEIKKIIHSIYKVDVTKVNIINVKSKTRRLGRTVGTKPGYKKAIVTLASGQKLDVLPQ
ncbi:MAG: 50S ribosomal protein L23 [bacterium]|nr:50S ribosomal protein L23 [bacterium]